MNISEVQFRTSELERERHPRSDTVNKAKSVLDDAVELYAGAQQFNDWTNEVAIYCLLISLLKFATFVGINVDELVHTKLNVTEIYGCQEKLV
jgi:hypothetical protein